MAHHSLPDVVESCFGDDRSSVTKEHTGINPIASPSLSDPSSVSLAHRDEASVSGPLITHETPPAPPESRCSEEERPDAIKGESSPHVSESIGSIKPARLIHHVQKQGSPEQVH